MVIILKKKGKREKRDETGSLTAHSYMLVLTMYQLRVETDFSAAHFLSHYHGKCERLHGHNYKVRLWVRGPELNEGGMLVDFSLLKKVLKEVVSLLDHTNLNDMEAFKNDPSAERIARFIYEGVGEKLPLAEMPGLSLEAVDVFENEGCMARYNACLY